MTSCNAYTSESSRSSTVLIKGLPKAHTLSGAGDSIVSDLRKQRPGFRDDRRILNDTITT